MTEGETFELAGIPIHGAQAQLGRLVHENILYSATVKQIRKIHFPLRSSLGYDCACREHISAKCPTLLALSVLADVETSK